MKLFLFAILAITLHQGFAGTIKDSAEAIDLKEIDSVLDLSQDPQYDSRLPFSCECDNISRCMCCGHLDIPRLNLDREACVRLSYNGDKTALTVTFIINDKVIFSRTVSAHNPPRMCFSYPPGNIIADLCFKFHKVQVKLNKLHSCLDLSPRIMMKDLMTFKIGCFQFGGNDEKKEQFLVEKV
ncbi:uncharacterized protein LOC129983273 [Argiope bruennichi]|uniref:uncharacterized protein LOC129983273 n=1 Tax=Argiope bruennichi TaxID=94029 RepID=UPI0024941D67|nr:uncharacterized protein LOC129983273 [Argiope bruennichi]